MRNSQLKQLLQQVRQQVQLLALPTVQHLLPGAQFLV
jgi:hypothetical protein